MLGVTAGPIDSARCTCHAGPGYPGERRCSGARSGRGDTGRTRRPRGGPPLGLSAPRRPPAARAPRPGQQPPAATASSGEGACWGGSSIYWRTVPDGERVAPSYSGSELVLSGVRTTTRQQLGCSSEAVSMPGSQAPVGLERIVATRRAHPEVVVAANDRVTREAVGLLPGESLSVQRHARELLIPQAGNFSSLKRMAIMIAGALDEGRQRGSVHQHALLWHMYRVIGSAVLSETHDLEFGWPLLGLPDPCGVARPGLAPIESAGVAAFHRDRSALDAARRGRGRGAGRGSGGNELEEVGDGAGRAAARAAAKAAARAWGKGEWWPWERRGRLHERLRNPRSPVVLAVAARKRRSAERPDQTVAGPRRRKQVEEACEAACEPLRAWARCEDQPKGWDFVLNEILPSPAERSAFAKEICAAVEEATMERAAGSDIAKAQLRSGAAVALRWLEAGGSEEHLLDGNTFTLPDRVEELFGSASRTSPLACKGDVRGRMRELMGEMLRQAPPEPLRFRAPPPAHHFGTGGVRGLHQHALCFRSPGAAGLGSGCQAATLAQRSDRRGLGESRHFRPGECTEGLLCGQPAGMEEGGAPHGAGRGACPQTLCHLVVPRVPSR